MRGDAGRSGTVRRAPFPLETTQQGNAQNCLHRPPAAQSIDAQRGCRVRPYIQRYNTVVATLTFEQARQCVLQKLCAAQIQPQVEMVSLSDAAGRVLAEPVTSDRDYPTLTRSVRDGFAVRAQDLPGDLFVIG